jgi:hypothetical protein
MPAGRSDVRGCLIALCALLAPARAANAVDTERIETLVRVVPGATCLRAHELALAVEPLLDDLRVPSDFEFLVEGSASNSRSARLHILRHGRPVAERAFEPGPERCSHLHAAVALAIALAINAAREEEERARVPEWSLSGSLLGTSGFVPQLGAGLELLLGRSFGEHVRLRLGPTGNLAFDASIGAPQGSFDAALAGARADGCVRGKLSTTLHALGCAGMLGGALYVSGDELRDSTRPVVPWLAVAAAASLELELAHRWSLALGFSLAFLLHRVEVGSEDATGAWQQSRELERLAFALGIGPTYYF